MLSQVFHCAHPKKWIKWLSLCEFLYNTNWHSSLNKSPYEVLYGHNPSFFGITLSDTVAPMDLRQWLDDREVANQFVRQCLLRTQRRMKARADKHRIEREVYEGDEVFLSFEIASLCANFSCPLF